MRRQMTVKAVNEFLAAGGKQERLERVGGRLRFVGGLTATWPQTEVKIRRVSDLTLMGWVEALEQLRRSASLAHARNEFV